MYNGSRGSLLAGFFNELPQSARVELEIEFLSDFKPTRETFRARL